MTLVVCTCPHCGGEVRMEDTLASGFCTYCGRQVINDKAVVGNINVRMDYRSDVVNTLKLAKYAMYDGDSASAVAFINKAMQMDAENSDVWFMDAVIDRRNAEKDIARGRQYPSLGIFSESEIEVYRNFDNTTGQTLFLVAIIFAFFAIFASVPVGIIFEMYYLIAAVFAVGIIAVLLAYFNMRSKKSNIPRPVFKDEEDAACDAAYEETMRRIGGN